MAEDSILAVDVVLLPPPSLLRLADTINAELFESAGSNEAERRARSFRFGPTHFAHLTVSQAYVRTSDLEKLHAGLEAIRRQPDGIPEMILDGFDEGPVFDGFQLPSLVIRNTPGIAGLHDQVTELLRPLRVRDEPGKPEYFFTLAPAQVDGQEDQPANSASRSWVANFEVNSSGAKYFPHVTLGAGLPETVRKLAEDWKAGKFGGAVQPKQAPQEEDGLAVAGEGERASLELFQLGNFCTCRLLLRASAENPQQQ